VIGRCARERQAEGDVHRAAERRDLDGGHPDIVIWSDDGVELAAQGAHEDGVGGKWTRDSSRARGRCEKPGVFVAKSSTVTRVRIQRAQGQPGLVDSKPFAQAPRRDFRRFDDHFRGQSSAHRAQRNVRGGEHHSQFFGSEHHGDPGTGERRQHLGVTGIVVAAGE